MDITNSMERIYDQGLQKDVQYFVGNEVEHTPQFGKRTLFVVGIKDTDEIISTAEEEGCKHIYLGANMSFNITDNTQEQWKPWEEMAFPLLNKKYWVTLDIDVGQVEGLLESGLTEHNRFIPMISVKIPYASQLGYNACVKIDDKDFDATNPGVWVHRMHDLKEKAVFTDWSKYTRDTIIT
jgi:hypothetical protein|tara:strand:- start:448 stop:990 length:543 start_codon:yes stop_codon:yes gene_type:complete